MQYAPIIIFAFNRLDSLKALVQSVQKNAEASKSDLYVFVDGYRENKKGEKEKVLAVQNFVKSISGFKSVNYTFGERNFGLGSSIISGVSEVIDKYGHAIVLEDDLIVQPNFLSFMNKGLSKYKDNKEVFSVCGYTNKIKVPKNYEYDGYFCTRSSSWGWTTWKDRWESVDWTFTNWKEWKTKKHDFNKWGGSDCFSMLEDCKNGRNKSWAIRFCFNQFLQNKVSLFPVKSLVINDGFDGNGTNCKSYSRFRFELMNDSKTNFIFPNDFRIIPLIKREVMHYNSISIRALSKLMYWLNKTNP